MQMSAINDIFAGINGYINYEHRDKDDRSFYDVRKWKTMNLKSSVLLICLQALISDAFSQPRPVMKSIYTDSAAGKPIPSPNYPRPPLERRQWMLFLYCLNKLLTTYSSIHHGTSWLCTVNFFPLSISATRLILSPGAELSNKKQR